MFAIRNMRRTIGAMVAMACLAAQAPAVSQASGSSPATTLCAGVSINVRELGQKQPVLLIGGAAGAKRTDMVPLYNAIERSWATGPGRRGSSFYPVYYAYPSHRKQWVDWTPDTDGPTVAKLVTCVARLSARNRGPGRVDLVTFSMGGLIALRAANIGSTGRNIGSVVTIAAPYKGVEMSYWRQRLSAVGTPLSRGLMPRSRALARMPKRYPRAVGTVTLIGGNFRRRNTDKIVPVQSAFGVPADRKVQASGVDKYATHDYLRYNFYVQELVARHTTNYSEI